MNPGPLTFFVPLSALLGMLVGVFVLNSDLNLAARLIAGAMNGIGLCMLFWPKVDYEYRAIRALVLFACFSISAIVTLIAYGKTDLGSLLEPVFYVGVGAWIIWRFHRR